MPVTVNLRKLLNNKVWSPVAPAPSAAAATTFSVQTPPNWVWPSMFYSTGTNTHWLYDPREDSWLELPGGTLGAHTSGSGGVFHPAGPTGTATAGSATTLTTNLTIPGSLAGYRVRITAGTGAGREETILSSTVGTNAVLTFATGTALDATSVYTIFSGRYWILGATGAAVVWKYYDVATNTWTAKSTTSGPGATWATDGGFVATAALNQAITIASGTATAGAAATLTNSAKNWTVNQWANYQVRITGGTGAGQTRTINSNTATVLTVSANWTVNPDATSVYAIEGNDDWIWVMGNNAVTLFRYAINGIAGLTASAQPTTDTWITVTPGAARAGAPGAGMSANFITSSTDPSFNTENTVQNGRRIYSFRGAAGAVLDYYDIPGNTWVSGVTYNRSTAVFGAGTSWVDWRGQIYGQKDATGRFYRFDCGKNQLDPLSTLLYPQGAATVGVGKTALFTYTDTNEVPFLYHQRNSGQELFRTQLF